MRARGWLHRLAAVALLGALASPVLADDAQTADDFLIVDCLLPAQIRQLGQNMTYLAARKAVRVTAHDCALRGGEFSRGDAGGPAGLQMWLPAANQGDAAAQTYVGEIFERGLAGQPDYAAAAQWYRRAADQNYAKAQIALGALVQQGLGVPKDPLLAAKLFRRAAGLPDDLPGDVQSSALSSQLATATATNAAQQKQLDAQGRQIAALQKKLNSREADANKDRASLKTLQDNLAKSKALAAQQQQQAPAPVNDDKTKALAKSLADRDVDLDRSKADIADLQAKLATAQKKAAVPTADPAELDRVKKALAAAQSDVAARQSETEALRSELNDAQANATDQGAKAQQLNASLDARNQELAQSKDTAAQLHSQLDTLQKKPSADPAEVTQLQGQLADAKGKMVSEQTQTDELRRQLQAAQAGGAARESDLNDKIAKLEQQVSDRQTQVASRDQEIQQLKDQVGKLNATAAAAPAPQERGAAPVEAPPPFPVAEFGHYHALVIGIDHYQRLPQLQTPVDDANAVAQVLRDQYGFDVVTLIDATRFQILSALNKLRQELTDQDNLLIYYAGHGVLDTVNQRGNWLPVDADPTDTTNWISNIQITDILNAMAARQILIVADSCYSGTLTRDVTTAIGHAHSASERNTYYKIMISKPSRVALTSGGLEPVADSGGGGHSLFAQLFIKALRDNSGAVATQEVYQEIEPAVATQMEQRSMHQVPEYAPIKMAGHEAGDFVFVRRTN